MTANIFEEFLDNPADSFKSQVNEAAKRLQEAQTASLEAEADAKAKKADLKQIQEVELPNLLETAGLKSCETLDGKKVNVSEYIRANIPDDKELDAYLWLEDNGHGDIIKDQIVVSYGKGNDDLASELEEFLMKQGVDYTRKRAVHHSTLSSLIKELMEEGVPVPLDLFGAYRQRIAKIK